MLGDIKIKQSIGCCGRIGQGGKCVVRQALSGAAGSLFGIRELELKYQDKARIMK